MSPHDQALLLDVPTELHTERLLVRAYRNGDGADLNAAIMCSLDHLTPWMPWVNPAQTADESEVYARRMQAQWIERKDFVFQIRRKTDNAFMGALGLHDPEWSVPKFMLGYWVTGEAAGQGFASEAATAVLAFGFEHLKAKRIWASCDADNTRSERVMQKLGMQREAVLKRDGRKVSGALRDTVIYAITDATPTPPQRFE
jgi:ribosomal-protein-serine acetyltransferase